MPPHPNEDELRQFARGGLSESAAERLAEHLAGCAACGNALAELTNTDLLAALAAAPTPLPDDVLARLRIDRYTVGDLLGQGGLGRVYAAIDPHGRAVALKVIRADAAADPAVVRRFLTREVATLRGLSHPNVVRYFNLLYPNTTPVLVMERVPGESLQAALDRAGGRPLPDAVGHARALLLAAEHLSHAGVAHRDVKPGNCVVTPSGTLKLVDFGLAKDADGPFDETVPGQLLGTPLYIAPEQIDDARRADHRSDLYAAGCVLFHLLTGRPPFEGKNRAVVLNKHAHERPTFPNAIPRRLAAVLARLLEKRPADRFQTATEALDALDAATAPPNRRRTIRWAAAGAVALALATTVAVWVLLAPPTTTTHAPTPPSPPAPEAARHRVENGVLTVDGSAGSHAVFFGHTDWRDYTLRVEVSWEGAAGGDVYFRSADERNGHRLSFGVAQPRFVAFRRADAGVPHPESGPIDCGLIAAGWATIKIRVAGGTATARANDRPAARGVSGPLRPDGRIGFGADTGAVCRFRNPSVTGPAGELLLSRFAE